MIKTRVIKKYREYVVQWTDGEISWIDRYSFKVGSEYSDSQAKEAAIDCAKQLKQSQEPSAIVWDSENE